MDPREDAGGIARRSRKVLQLRRQCARMRLRSRTAAAGPCRSKRPRNWLSRSYEVEPDPHETLKMWRC
jgi:hypothetical protein